MVPAVAVLLRGIQERNIWLRAGEVFIGLFFNASAVFKTGNYFIDHDQSLAGHFQYWVQMGTPLAIYATFIQWIFSFAWGAKTLEIATIGCQGIGGLLLLFGWRVRIGGLLLLFIQTNVFLGTFHHRGFNYFVGLSVWIALFYSFDMTRRKVPSPLLRSFFTSTLAVLVALFLYNRYFVGDPWLSVFAWQRLHFQQDILSVSPSWKHAVLFLSSLPGAAYVWASSWWLHIVFILLLFSPYALLGGAGILTLSILRTLTWMNSITSEGVLLALVFFCWLTHEEYVRRRDPANGWAFAAALRTMRSRFISPQPFRATRGTGDRGNSMSPPA